MMNPGEERNNSKTRKSAKGPKASYSNNEPVVKVEQEGCAQEGHFSISFRLKHSFSLKNILVSVGNQKCRKGVEKQGRWWQFIA